jgi:hypothetical protein
VNAAATPESRQIRAFRSSLAVHGYAIARSLGRGLVRGQRRERPTGARKAAMRGSATVCCPRSDVYGQAVQQHRSGPVQGGHIDFKITIHDEKIGVVARGEPTLACADPACLRRT